MVDGEAIANVLPQRYHERWPIMRTCHPLNEGLAVRAADVAMAERLRPFTDLLISINDRDSP
jgi:hypothetical protein